MTKITYDPAKDAANKAKHGISLSLAEEIDWDAADLVPDDRRAYGEARWIAAAPVHNRLHMVVFVFRGDTLRIISMRKANKREVRNYEDKAKARDANR